jgi:hypothetical protein
MVGFFVVPTFMVGLYFVVPTFMVGLYFVVPTFMVGNGCVMASHAKARPNSTFARLRLFSR